MTTTYRQDLVLSSRLEKNRPFLELILEIVRELLPAMNLNVPFVLSELCVDYWDILNDYQKRLAGMFIARVVSLQLLPLRVIGKRGNTLVYQMIA
jgi:hypothetical protein